jgi:hypothetical protein
LTPDRRRRFADVQDHRLRKPCLEDWEAERMHRWRTIFYMAAE